MFKKIKIVLIFLLIFGLYTGWYVDPGVCNGPYRQKALGVSIIKPFFPGTWHLYFGIGNKHWDYKQEKTISYYTECEDIETGEEFIDKDHESEEHFLMDCVYIRKERIHESGCAYWYNKDYYLQGDIIDLTPWSRRIKD